MSAPPKQPAEDPRPKLDSLTWAVLTYTDGELGNALDAAKAKLVKDIRANRWVVAEWAQSPTKFVKAERVQTGVDPHDGTPQWGERRTCRIYLVAITKPAPPERWVRLTAPAGPAAVEVATVERGKVVKVDTYHPEDIRSVAVGMANRALEETGG